MKRNKIYKPVELHNALVSLSGECLTTETYNFCATKHALREVNDEEERDAHEKENHCQLRNDISSVLDQTFNFFLHQE